MNTVRALNAVEDTRGEIIRMRDDYARLQAKYDDSCRENLRLQSIIDVVCNYYEGNCPACPFWNAGLTDEDQGYCMARNK